MGPLVPYIISEEFNLVIALIIGFGFGFILEQAGFSSTKKLVGLFYGYVFVKTRSLLPSMIVHYLGNVFIGSLTGYMQSRASIEIQTLYGVVFSLGVVPTALMILWAKFFSMKRLSAFFYFSSLTDLSWIRMPASCVVGRGGETRTPGINASVSV